MAVTGFETLTRSTLSLESSARNALMSPKRGSSGAWGTMFAGKLVDDAILRSCGVPRLNSPVRLIWAQMWLWENVVEM